MAGDGMWFAPKRYGYGAGLPIAWQGWVVLGGLVIAALVVPQLLPDHRLLSVGLLGALVLALLPLVAARTRGGWRWRWGEDD